MSEQQSDFMQGFYRGRAEGVIVEQERIIKLLEEQRAEYAGLGGSWMALASGIDDAISLITGRWKKKNK